MLSVKSTNAQLFKPNDHDSTYYESFPEQTVVRTYFSRKYTTFALRSSDNKPKFKYIPNSTLNYGVGVTYKLLSLNIAYGFNFLNNKDRVKTKYLDLQAHIYGRRWVIDLFGEFYKGYYLNPKGFAAPSGNDYYVRPDLKVALVGASVYRLLNERRFTYRPGFPQDEWQKKSAGSLLLGAEIYYGATKGDSAFVPTEKAPDYNQLGIDNIKFFQIGPGIGYAYTLVIAQHFFVTASLVLNMSATFAQESGSIYESDKFSFTPNYMTRAVVGYSGRKHIFTLSLVEKGINVKGVASSERYILRTGNYRLTYGMRLWPSPRLKKRLSFMDRILEK